MAVLNIQITHCNLPLRRGLAQLQQFFTTQGAPDPASPMHRAMVAVGNSIHAETTYIGYADCFALLGVVLLCAIVVVAMLKKGTVAAGGAH
jgi:DHA2 family multidrug resistance protein